MVETYKIQTKPHKRTLVAGTFVAPWQEKLEVFLVSRLFMQSGLYWEDIGQKYHETRLQICQ